MPAKATTRVTTVNLLQMVLALRFPEPFPEYHFARQSEGPQRLWRFDLAWLDYWVAFEREGNTWTKGKVIPGINSGKSRHSTAKGYRDDIEKYNEAALLGWCVIRATADMIQDGSAWTILERALISKRWRRPEPRNASTNP